jgi:hypothetical protein
MHFGAAAQQQGTVMALAAAVALREAGPSQRGGSAEFRPKIEHVDVEPRV